MRSLPPLVMLWHVLDDTGWLAQAYAAHADAVYRLCRGILRDADDAQDVTHAVFERALTRRHRYDSARPLLPWLLGIASNESLHHRRRLRIRRHLHLGRTLEAETPPDRNMVWQAVGRLPAGHRAAVLLHYVHGYTLDEIAAILEIPGGTVASRLHTARRRMRASLEGGDLAEEARPS